LEEDSLNNTLFQHTIPSYVYLTLRKLKSQTNMHLKWALH